MMTWIRVIGVIIFVFCGLWVFNPEAHQPKTVYQMQIGFLDEAEDNVLDWNPVVTGEDESSEEIIEKVSAIFTDAEVLDGVSCFTGTADMEVIILDVNTLQYIVDGGIYYNEAGGIYQTRSGDECRSLSKADIEYLKQLQQ